MEPSRKGSKENPLPRTLIEIDRSSREPLYRQVRRAIEHGIAVGTFDVHQRLPSSRELAAELGVSRNTINLAYQELVAEGYVESKERSGLFVNSEMRPHCAVQEHDTRSRIDWSARMRRYPDADVPHIESAPTGTPTRTRSSPGRPTSAPSPPGRGRGASATRCTSRTCSTACRTASARTTRCWSR